MKRKTERIGEEKQNKQHLTMRIIKYYNNKNVVIRFLETGEERKVSYIKFRRGTPMANLWDYPIGGDCSFKQAKRMSIGLAVIAVGLISALIYAIVK